MVAKRVVDQRKHKGAFGASCIRPAWLAPDERDQWATPSLPTLSFAHLAHLEFGIF